MMDTFEDRLRAELVAWADDAPVTEAAAPPPVPSRLSRPRPWLAVAAAAAVVVLVAGVLVRQRSDDEQVRVIDDTATTVLRTAIGGLGVRGLDADADRLVLLPTVDARLYVLDPVDGRLVDALDVPDHIEGVQLAGDAVLASRFEPDEVLRIDLETGAVTARAGFASQPAIVQFGGSVWVADDTPAGPILHQLDEESFDEVGRIDLPAPAGFLSSGAEHLWMASLGSEAAVVRIDPVSGRTDLVDLQAAVGERTRAIDVGSDGRVWATVGDRVVGIDPVTLEVVADVDVGRTPLDLAIGGSTIWVSNIADGTVSRLDVDQDPPALRTMVVGLGPAGLAPVAGGVWVSLNQEGGLVRIGEQAELPTAVVADVEQVVETPGGEVYVRCAGRHEPGRPTVVLEADLRQGAGSWGSVEADLATTGRVCATDRALLHPDAPTTVGGRSPGDLADDLLVALASVGEPGPFVVIAHGWGALPAELLAVRHRASVAGLVLLDPLSIDLYDELRPRLDARERAALDESLRSDPDLAGTEAGIEELRAAGTFGTLPLIVVAADPEVLRAEALRATGEQPVITPELLGRLQQELAGWSVIGELTVARSSGHRIAWDEPAAVLEAVDRVVRASAPAGG